MSVHNDPYLVDWPAFQNAPKSYDEHEEFKQQFVCLTPLMYDTSAKVGCMLENHWHSLIAELGYEIPELKHFIWTVYWGWFRDATRIMDLDLGELMVDFAMSPDSVRDLFKPVSRYRYDKEIRALFELANANEETAYTFGQVQSWLNIFDLALYNEMGLVNYQE